MVSGDHLEEFHTALAKFLGNADPKASILASVVYVQALKGVRLFFSRASILSLNYTSI